MAQRLPRLLLVCGLPATGKTTFGDWLCDTHEYIHLDLESRDCLVTSGLPEFWSERIWDLNDQELRDFFDYLLTHDRATVMTWAFHTDLLPLVRSLVGYGCQPWWFDADRVAARHAFRTRKRIIKEGVIVVGEPDMRNYDWHISSLDQHQEEIASIFNGNTVETLLADGTRLTCTDIWTLINRSAPLT